MKAKFVALLVVLVGVLAIGLIRTASQARRNQRNEPSKNRLQWHVQQAKSEGRAEVFIEPPVVDYLGSEDSNIDEVLSSHTVVVAKPIESRAYEQDGNHLITWTKFKIVERLSEIRPPVCFGCNSMTPPSDMLPLQSEEFLVPRQGGTMVREGIRLTEKSKNYPFFVQSQKYLMLISLYPSGIALTVGGPLGIFAVDSDENLEPLNKEPHALKEGLKIKFKDSLHQLRDKIKQSY